MATMALFKVEWIKTMRMRSTYIAFVAVGLLITMIQIAIYVGQDKSDFVRRFKEFDLDPTWLINGYQSTLLTLIAAFMLLIAPMTIVTFARQVAGEDLRGTLRLILTRPISRFQLLNAKFAICAAYTLLLMGFFFALSYGMGLMLFGPKDSLTFRNTGELSFSNIDSDFRQYDRSRRTRRWEQNVERMDWRASPQGRMIQDRIRATMEAMVITPGESVRKLVLAWLLSSWSLLTLGSLAFLYSVINKHPIAAMALTIGTYFMVVILQGLAASSNLIPLFQAIEPYLFTTAMDFWTECLAKEIDWSKIWPKMTLLGCYTVGFYGLAQFIFWRKDITS